MAVVVVLVQKHLLQKLHLLNQVGVDWTVSRVSKVLEQVFEAGGDVGKCRNVRTRLRFAGWTHPLKVFLKLLSYILGNSFAEVVHRSNS